MSVVCYSSNSNSGHRRACFTSHFTLPNTTPWIVSLCVPSKLMHPWGTQARWGIISHCLSDYNPISETSWMENTGIYHSYKFSWPFRGTSSKDSQHGFTKGNANLSDFLLLYVNAVDVADKAFYTMPLEFNKVHEMVVHQRLSSNHNALGIEGKVCR